MEALIKLLHESDTFHGKAVTQVLNNPALPVRVENYVHHLLDEENGVIMVAERDATIVGLVQLAVFSDHPYSTRAQPDHAVIGDLVVAEELRRMGIGSRLIAAASDWAKARGAATIELEVWEFNREAEAFYESLGYQAVRHTMLKPLY